MSAPEPLLPVQTLLQLGPEFYDSVRPANFPKLELRYHNPALCDQLRWGAEDLTAHLGHFQPVPGSLPEPLAMRYHGHQFQHYNPQLGDGRGFTFAQFSENGKLWELGTKGSGQTPWSRQGDGRLTLKGAMRESLATELLESLGVNTSRTLAFFETGEELVRGDEPSPTRSAVLTRFSDSHIRFGNFQRFTYLQQPQNLRKLFAYVREHWVRGPYPQYFKINSEVTGLFSEVLRRSADLVAQWMMAGFVHGVLNTDNMNITGESFDYGPFRFLPTYNPAFTAAYFDESGLYAYGKQPHAVLWNLHQLGFCLRVLEPRLELDQISPAFERLLQASVRENFLRRLNLRSLGDDKDEALLVAFFAFLATSQAPFEQTFFDFFRGREASPRLSPRYSGEGVLQLFNLWDEFSARDLALAKHPYFQRTTPITCLIEEVEALWDPIRTSNDWGPYQHHINEIRSFRGLYAKTMALSQNYLQEPSKS